MPHSTCLIPECTKGATRSGRCGAHYAKARAAGEFGAAELCIWPECERVAMCRGFCGTHHARSMRLGHIENPWITYDAQQAEKAAAKAARECKWPECGEKKLKAYGMCISHYRRAEVLSDMAAPWKLWRPGKACATCGEWIDKPIHNRQYCSRDCSNKVWRKQNLERIRERNREASRRRHARKRSTQVKHFTDKDVRMTHGDVCYLCGEKINFRLKFPHPNSPTVDHIVPLSRGGSHTLENAAMVHFLCNNKKGAKDAPTLPQPTLLAI